VGLLARDESARARGQDKTSDRTSFELVGISLRLDESKRASERAVPCYGFLLRFTRMSQSVGMIPRVIRGGSGDSV